MKLPVGFVEALEVLAKSLPNVRFAYWNSVWPPGQPSPCHTKWPVWTLGRQFSSVVKAFQLHKPDELAVRVPVNSWPGESWSGGWLQECWVISLATSAPVAWQPPVVVIVALVSVDVAFAPPLQAIPVKLNCTSVLPTSGWTPAIPSCCS